MLARYTLSSCVRPFVRPTVRLSHCTKTAKLRITQTTLYDSPEILFAISFTDVNNIGEILISSFPTGATNRGGVGYNQQLSTNISLYLRNGAR